MDSLAATSLFSALNFIIIIFISSVSTGEFLEEKHQINITAQTGQDTFLPCRSPDNKPVLVLEWIRSDLGSDYVLLYRNDHLDLENQHVMFKDRVDLQDRQMKDGNVSLVLKNVTTDDRGAYECQVIQTENSRRKTIIIINLDVVTSPGEPDGGNRVGPAGPSYLVVGLVVASVIFVIFVISVICVYWIRKKPLCLSPKSNQSSEEPLQAEQPLTGQNQPAEQ